MIKDKVSKIMKAMNEIEYGFKDNLGNNILMSNPEKWDTEFGKFYYLQTPEELLKTKCGVCWDQVELERVLFLKEKINVKTFFVYISDGGMLPSHTFLTYEYDNKYYWFEHSWAKYSGVHEYDSELNMLLDVREKFKKDYNEVRENVSLYLYEYQKPKEHIKCDEFYEYIKTQSKIQI